MTTVIGIAGSARKNGNSTTLMRAVLKGAASAGADTKEIYLNGIDYKGCRGCEKCSAKGSCIINDDLTPILTELGNADGWILASPIYYDGITGQLKTFFDRCRTFTRNPETQELKPQLEGKRYGAVVITYADNERKDYLHEAEKLASYMNWMGDFGRVEVIMQSNLHARNDAADQPDLISNAEKLGKHLFSGDSSQT